MFLAGASSAYSGIIYSGLQFIDPVVQFAVNNDTKISGATIPGEGGSYTFSAELCQTGFCTGDSSIATELRLTNLSLTCSGVGGGPCAPVDISFLANGSTTDPSAAFDVSLDSGSFTGPGPVSGQGAICIATGSTFCSATASGSLSSTFTFGDGISGNLVFPFNVSGSSFTVVGDLSFSGLSDGTTVTLGNSFKVTATPEPSTIVLLSAPLAVFFLLRRRRFWAS